ncbi:hypothetical protein MKZ38_007871 [Zalerion maritima]|uniref:Lysyl-tRNA synthetase n=1 Tax=Zalerion maritima TaxID=339359 RepID=A0AAD5RVE5_9PEZI|nr:hypothetical protein MKZ38_007871 [Zalerion maritima]
MVPDGNRTDPLSTEGQVAHFNKLGAGVRERIDQLRQAQALKYPRMKRASKEKPWMSVPDFEANYGPARFSNDAFTAGDLGKEIITLGGRVRSIRRVGSKLAFIDVTYDFGLAQIMVDWKSTLPSLLPEGIDEKQHLASFKNVMKLMKRGDIISVTGFPRKTEKTGAVCLSAAEIPEILSPSITALPDTISEGRMRNRHLDLLVNKSSWGPLLLRSHIVSILRKVFEDTKFLEVSTPILASNASGAVATPFETSHRSSSSNNKSLALRIAPELWLKRLVVSGFERIYELGPAFRDEGMDLSHNPEFTMCEFYMAYATLDELIEWTENMLGVLARELPSMRGLPEGQPDGKFVGAIVNARRGDGKEKRIEFPRVEFLPTLEDKLGIRFKDLEMHLPSGKERLVQTLVEANALDASEIRTATAKEEEGEGGAVSKLFDLLAEKYLETHHKDVPFFLTHQPAFMSPLSKWFVCPRTGVAVAARAELFYNGMELANMYEEENCPFEQRRKFLGQKKGGGGEEEDLGAWGWRGDVGFAATTSAAPSPPPAVGGNGGGSDGENAGAVDGGGEAKAEGKAEGHIDEQYVETLLAGMPPTGGWGCGVDRLVMLFSGRERIADTLPFGNLKNVRAYADRSRKLARGEV